MRQPQGVRAGELFQLLTVCCTWESGSGIGQHGGAGSGGAGELALRAGELTMSLADVSLGWLSWNSAGELVLVGGIRERAE